MCQKMLQYAYLEKRECKNMVTIYPAIFHEEDGAFWVEFPDLEGCQTCGSTLREAICICAMRQVF